MFVSADHSILSRLREEGWAEDLDRLERKSGLYFTYNLKMQPFAKKTAPLTNRSKLCHRLPVISIDVLQLGPMFASKSSSSVRGGGIS